MISTFKSELLFTVVLFLVQNYFQSASSFDVKVVNATLENVYSFEIRQGQKHILLYQYVEGEKFSVKKLGESVELISNIKHEKIKTALVISTTAEFHSNAGCPLIVTVNQRNSVIFWEVRKTKTDKGNISQSTTSLSSKSERTVCLNEQNAEPNNSLMVTVELSTCSKSPIKYTLATRIRRDLAIRLNEKRRSLVTASSPIVHYFAPLLPQGNFPVPEFLFIKVASSDEACSILSIQKPTCPISDSLSTVMYRGQWQTFRNKTGLTIPTADFPSGFFIVFLLLEDDTWCNYPSLEQPESRGGNMESLDLRKPLLIEPRMKVLEFEIHEKMPTREYSLAILIPLGLFLTFISIIFAIHLHFHKIRCDFHCIDNFPTISSSVMQAVIETPDLAHQRACTTIGNGHNFGSTDSILRSRIQISELMNSQPERLMVQSKRYYMAGILVASFYCVPVFQLILSYHRRLLETGNYDLCYFNHYCSHMWGIFQDFNHIYSNIGYLLCGPLFMCIVYLRQMSVDMMTSPSARSRAQSVCEVPMGDKLNNKWLPRAPWDISKGVFVHHGLFYAMGFSLFMTGVMSAAYHICPNQNNFQFDTAFMYTIAALGIVTIYQFRHPTYVSATMTFMVLAVVAASTVVGLLWDSFQFRLFFTVSHITFLLLILIYIHYVGYIRVDGVTVTEWRKMVHILRQKWTDDLKNFRLIGFQRDVWSPQGHPKTIVLPGPCRFVFPLMVIIVNSLALLMIWTMMSDANFASQVLAVYVTNCSVYKIYYSVMKWIHFECRRKLWIQPAIYLTTSIFLWAWSLSYFGDMVTLWERSPAESRSKNSDCIFLGFYDSHDVWHFISAAALFSSLMSLLTMDDDLIDKPKSEIPVF